MALLGTVVKGKIDPQIDGDNTEQQIAKIYICRSF
jgi:hypothetical protein